MVTATLNVDRRVFIAHHRAGEGHFDAVITTIVTKSISIAMSSSLITMCD
jgi:hypothetical protein